MTDTRGKASFQPGKANYVDLNLEGVISTHGGFSDIVERPRGWICQSTRSRKNEGQGIVRREEGCFTAGRMALTDEGELTSWPTAVNHICRYR